MHFSNCYHGTLPGVSLTQCENSSASKAGFPHISFGKAHKFFSSWKSAYVKRLGKITYSMSHVWISRSFFTTSQYDNIYQLGSPRPPQFQIFTKTPCTRVLIARIYYSNKIEGAIGKRKWYTRWSLEEIRYNLLRVFSQGSHQWQYSWNAVDQGSSLQPQCPGFSLGAVTGALCA